jgi:hypothetical protein
VCIDIVAWKLSMWESNMGLVYLAFPTEDILCRLRVESIED